MKHSILMFLFFLPGTFLFSQDFDSVRVILLKPSEFREEMNTVNYPMLIDVREFFEYKKKRIKGAVNIPSSGNLDLTADTIDKTRHLFFYCTSGFRSKRVAQRFRDKGFLHLYSLDGGITDWKKEGYPVIRKKIKR